MQIGLISQVCPADRLAGEADALVERILRLDPDCHAALQGIFLRLPSRIALTRTAVLALEALTVGSLAVLAKEK